MVKTRRFRGGKKSKRHTHHKRLSTHRRKVKRYSRRGTKRRRRKRTKRVKRGGGNKTRKIMVGGGRAYFIGLPSERAQTPDIIADKISQHIADISNPAIDPPIGTEVESDFFGGHDKANVQRRLRESGKWSNAEVLSGGEDKMMNINARRYNVKIGDNIYPILRWKDKDTWNKRRKSRANAQEIVNYFTGAVRSRAAAAAATARRAAARRAAGAAAAPAAPHGTAAAAPHGTARTTGAAPGGATAKKKRRVKMDAEVNHVVGILMSKPKNVAAAAYSLLTAERVDSIIAMNLVNAKYGVKLKKEDLDGDEGILSHLDDKVKRKLESEVINKSSIYHEIMGDRAGWDEVAERSRLGAEAVDAEVQRMQNAAVARPADTRAREREEKEEQEENERRRRKWEENKFGDKL